MPGPPRMPLTPRQAEVLSAAAAGEPLAVVAGRLGITREQVAARLSEAYRRLDVAHVPRDRRRAAAVRAARRLGLIPHPPDPAPTVPDELAVSRCHSEP